MRAGRVSPDDSGGRSALREKRSGLVPPLLVAVLCVGVPAGVRAQVTLDDVHVDLNIQYFAASNTWGMQTIDQDVGQTFGPSGAILLVKENARVVRPADPAYSFVGVGPGESFYLLPQSQEIGKLYLGFAAYGVASSDIDRYNAGAESNNRVSSSPGNWTRLQLVSVTGANGTAAPGSFSVWQDRLGGGITPFMSSYDDNLMNQVGGFNFDTTDGITLNDQIWLTAGSHLHYNFGFTAPGVYEVTLRPAARRNNGDPQTAGEEIASANPFTFIFNVQGGGSFAVPEPTSGALPGILLAGTMITRRYRARTGVGNG
jgi:surface-anchored protein